MMKSVLFVVLLIALCSRAAKAQNVAFAYQNNYIGQGAYVEATLTAQVAPVAAPVTIFIVSSSGAVGAPATVVLPANSTTPQKFNLLGNFVSDPYPVSVNLYTTTQDPNFAGFNITASFIVFATCGVISFTNTSSTPCPNSGDFLYFAGLFQRPFDIYNGMMNVTVLEGSGFDLYYSATFQCPSTSSYTLTINDKPYTRVDASYFIAGNTDSNLNFNFVVGLRKRSDVASCSFTVYVFDAKNATNQPTPNMVCVTPLYQINSCSSALLPWQIAVIVIVVIVVVALIILGVFLAFRYFRGKKV